MTRTSVRRTALSVAAWCLVVALGSSLVWSVISGAGQDFVGEDRALPGAPESVAPPPSTPTTSASASTSTKPSTSPSTKPSTSPSTSPSASRSTTTDAPGDAAVSTTWSGSAGVVTTRCVGARISLVRALPSADGYVIEVKDRGPDEVDVEFEGRGDETVPETRVRARCVDGKPRYDARVED